MVTLKGLPFDFQGLIESHGWVHLAPFSWAGDRKVLGLATSLEARGPVTLTVSARSTDRSSVVTIEHDRCVSAAQQATIAEQVTRMLWLNHSFEEFHKICRDDALLRSASRSLPGGLLRAPTAFEDLVKTVCTTNCDWRNTKKMAGRLCVLGDGAFPAPSRLLAYSEKELAEKTGVGYRARTILQVCALTDAGKLPLDELARGEAFGEIEKLLLAVWGIGSYCANHMLVLLGRFDQIPVDSEVLRYLRKRHFGGTPVSATEAVKPYTKYGRFAYLAYKHQRIAERMNYVNK